MSERASHTCEALRTHGFRIEFEPLTPGGRNNLGWSLIGAVEMPVVCVIHMSYCPFCGTKLLQAAQPQLMKSQTAAKAL